MKLLTSALVRRPRALPAGSAFTALVALCLVGLEVAGRYATSDAHDGLAGLGLLAVCGAVAARHRRAPLPWVTAAAGWGRRAAAAASWLRYDHGVDLRGSPPFPRRTPAVVGAAVLLLALWGVLAGVGWAAFPTGWRAVGVHTLYLPYLVFLLALWAVLMTCGFVGVFVPVAVIDRWLRGWVGETDRRGAELTAVVGYAVLVSAVAWVVPPTAVLVLCLVAAAGAWVAYLPLRPDTPAVLWRAGPGRPVNAVPLGRLLAMAAGLVALVLFDVLLTACGGRLSGGPPADDETMPVTAFLGAVTAWLVPGFVCVAGCRLWAAWRTDPAGRTPPAVSVTGADRAARRRAAGLIRRWGWAAGSGGTVGVEVVEPARSEVAEFDPRWPLRVSEADLAAGGVKGRLDRRDEIQVRRQLFRGLAKLFKRASAFKGPGGGGYWLAPHWWFIEGLAREDADAADDPPAPPVVGPPYGRALTPRARQQAHRVLRATQVDMIFVEDGVGYRKLEKVLRVLLELYDVHGGKRKAEDQHFSGLPKVKVMIHEYEPGNPFRSDLYPEPKFDDLSRVRVLHVFRDRGGHEELVEPPFDFSWSPADPAGLLV